LSDGKVGPIFAVPVNAAFVSFLDVRSMSAEAMQINSNRRRKSAKK
jgi:hypothetical protein